LAANRSFLRWLLLAAWLGTPPGAAAADGTLHPLVDAMTRMMDAFGLIDRYRWNAEPTPYPGHGWSGALPQAPADATRHTPLEGIWLATNGGGMVIRQGLVRLYASPEVYQDFYLKLQGRLLLLRDARSGQVRSYDFALQGGRLVLLDRNGNLLLFRRAAPPGR
jgi:hypothetical protein